MNVMQSDIELAIIGLREDRHNSLIDKIPCTYAVEDRSANGYGLVIRSESSESSEEINAKLEKFLRPLLLLIEMFNGCDCIIRIAVFNSLTTTTVTFSSSCLEILRNINARLEVSVYPLDEECA